MELETLEAVEAMDETVVVAGAAAEEGELPPKRPEIPLRILLTKPATELMTEPIPPNNDETVEIPEATPARPERTEEPPELAVAEDVVVDGAGAGVVVLDPPPKISLRI